MGDDDWWDHMNGVMNGGHMSNGWLWWPLWLLLVAVVVAVVVLAVVLAGRHPTDTQTRGAQAPPPPPAPGPRPEDAAEALLRERYARGEIDESEYDARLARLRSSR